MPRSLAEAAEARLDRLFDEEIDSRLSLLLSNYQRVTANPSAMGHLRFLLRYYAKKPHPFTACVHDNMKRFGPGHTERVCAVLKDTIRQTTYWRHGQGGHSKVPDSGSPGVGIAEADAPAAHRFSERPITLLDELDAEFGVIDHCEPILEAFGILSALADQGCDVYRVLIGLDEPPEMAVAA